MFGPVMAMLLCFNLKPGGIESSSPAFPFLLCVCGNLNVHYMRCVVCKCVSRIRQERSDSWVIMGHQAAQNDRRLVITHKMMVSIISGLNQSQYHETCQTHENHEFRNHLSSETTILNAPIVIHLTLVQRPTVLRDLFSVVKRGRLLFCDKTASL